MSPEIIFSLQLVLGYVAWLICFGVYIMPRLKAMDRVAAHRAIATLNSFRFFPAGARAGLSGRRGRSCPARAGLG